MSARTYGAAGEAFAASALEAEGYRILERNWRSGRSEIDLIAQRGTYYRLYTGAFELE